MRYVASLRSDSTTSKGKRGARNRVLAASAFALAGLMSVNSAQAAIGTWTGGSTGTWDTTATNWSGVSGTPWAATGNTAKFTGFGDVATISGSVFATQILVGDTGVSSTATLNGSSGVANTGSVLVGDSSINNTLNISGTDRVVLTGSNNMLRIGNAFNGNSVVLSAPGNSTTPSFIMSGTGTSIQLNIGTSSSNNSLTVQSGAYFKFSAGSGTLTWSLGKNSGANGNSILVTGSDGAGNYSTMNKNSAGSYMEIGSAGSNNHLNVENGGQFLSGRLGIGTNGGANNYMIVTGPGSTYTSNGTSNQFMDIGQTSGSNTNSLRVEDGGTVNFGGSGTSRRVGVGQVAGADTNYISIKGVNGRSSTMNFVHTGLPLVIGGSATGSTTTSGGTSNYLEIINGGYLNMVNFDPDGAGPLTAPNALIPAGSSSLVLTGTTSYVDLGKGESTISTATVGATTNFGSGVVLKNADGRLNINNGRLIAGVAGNLVSGAGKVELNGLAFISTAFSSTISTVIEGVAIGGLTKEGSGTLELTQMNTYLGDTIVTEGTLQIDQAYLADTAGVFVTSGTLNLATGVSDTIRSLYLDGVLQSAGTWGADGNTNATHQVSWITGTGWLNVTSGAAVPEPASLSLLAVSGLGLLIRRRKPASPKVN